MSSQITGYLGAIGKPFILGGDWQTHPEILRDSGWPSLSHARVIAPKESTYVSGNTRSTKDYFVVSEVLAEYADASCDVFGTGKAGTEEAALIPKHKPVILTISGGSKK